MNSWKVYGSRRGPVVIYTLSTARRLMGYKLIFFDKARILRIGRVFN